MSRSRLDQVRNGALLIISAVGLGSGPPPLTCPPGAKLESRALQGRASTAEFCRDRKSGWREGPYREIAANGVILKQAHYKADKLDGQMRSFDERGQLKSVSEYSAGTLVVSRMTQAAMEEVARKMNARARKAGETWRLSVRDEHTMVQTTPVAATSSLLDAETVRARAVADPRVCGMFRHVMNLETMVARYVDEVGQERLVVPIRRSDCRM
jgi:hypothetical protein